MANSYSYMNEDEIDDELKCAVCRAPLNGPVSSRDCHHTFCYQCITACIDRERRCPVCRRPSQHEDYERIRSRALMNQLNRLLVRCDACQRINIQRGDFDNHKRDCLNWIIPCSAADIRCSWQGMRNRLTNHLRTCPFQQIRPVIDHLQQQTNDLRRNQFLLRMVVGLFFIFLFVFMLVGNGQSKQPRSFGEKFSSLFGD